MTSDSTTAIEVRGARTHNLKGVDCRIPQGKLTVVTGVSGAGKSSLAFDTIYAEAQRRFVESMSTYVRQFLEQMERPPVESIDNVLPSLALEARNSVKNARATVGTLTEVHDVLRLIYAHSGEVLCPKGHEGTVSGRGPQQVADLLLERYPKQSVLVVAALERPKRQADLKLRELVRQGYFRRLLEGGEIERLKPQTRWPTGWQPLRLVLGRFRLEASKRTRLLETLEEGYALASGRLQIFLAGEELNPEEPALYVGRGLTCERCGEAMERPTPPLFSFNSPLGACGSCQGFGRVLGVDRRRVIPDPSKSLEERPIAPWNSKTFERHYPKLLAACRAVGIATHVPLSSLPEEDREYLWSGLGPFTNLDRFFARLERKNYRMHVRVLLARYRSYDTCPECEGRRLKPQALAVRWRGLDLAELSALSIERLCDWIDEGGVEGTLEVMLRERLETLRQVGLGYLSLDRLGRTLSGGESQRIQLASALGNGLTGTLYVLDEPTIGLHPRDSDRLLGMLRGLSDRGNTVLVVEHDRTLIEGADHVIDLGPGAGEHGGELLVQGEYSAILEHAESATARYMKEPPPAKTRAELEDDSLSLQVLPRVGVRGARHNNLCGFDVELPLGCLVAVTGVSGSGKSTLVENVIYGGFQRSRGTVDVDPGECDGLVGFETLADVVLVDQRPLGRSSRSNPVTYVKAWDAVRKLFAATPQALGAGISPGHFSFNVDRGRCEMCKGTGTTEVDMHFMAPVSVVCESCQGRRFKPEVLAVRWRGLAIDQVLELTVAEAIEFFADSRGLVRKLRTLVDVGLGYLRLGQSTATLSGGEAQRLKLATFVDSSSLAKKGGPRLFLFDEPTTGLHLADIDLLHQTLRKLLGHGHGVVVVEHSTDLVARCDWIVDLGPEGGSGGGQLLFSGPLADFLSEGSGPTAEVLRQHVGRSSRAA
ncbi:MAG: excinuclease ABC subunit UvrA [Acidobacteriota bacterium]